MNTKEAADYIVAVATEALQGIAVVVSDPEDATGHLLAGTPCVVVAPPSITGDTGPARVLRFETPVIGAPLGDKPAAWDAVDTIIDRLTPYIEFERAEPITWAGAQSATAPAYLITHTLTVFKETPNA
jgi:hypothetical protein